MTNIDIEKKHNNFLRLDRTIFEDYANNKISLDEKDILVHLQVWANPNNAKTKISYQGLADDFKGRYEKNAVNKIILSLKKKKYLWFPNQQGCRGSFIIIMNNYPLSNGYFTDLFKDSETTGRSLDSNIVDNSELCLAEVPTGWQKIKEQKDKLAKTLSVNPQTSSRSSNNDNDNKNEKKLSISSREGKSISEFNPKTPGGIRCKEIALELGETKIDFLCSAFHKYGMDCIEKNFRITKDAILKGKIKNKGAYFNSLFRDNEAKEVGTGY